MFQVGKGKIRRCQGVSDGQWNRGNLGLNLPFCPKMCPPLSGTQHCSWMCRCHDGFFGVFHTAASDISGLVSLNAPPLLQRLQETMGGNLHIPIHCTPLAV